MKKNIRGFNNFTLYLKFTNEFGKTKISFLDHNTTLTNTKLITHQHIKSTDVHQLLHYLFQQE